MPSAPPNSEQVSEIAAAAPARSGGAAPMMRSFARVNTGERPSENTTVLTTRMASPEVPIPPIATNPAAAMTRPPHMRKAGRTRRARIGESIDPATKPRARGIDQSPAASGDRPSTSWRYCAMNTYGPNTMKVASR